MYNRDKGEKAMDIKINYLEIENIKNVESGRIDFFRKDHYLNLIKNYLSHYVATE